jgi:hypothetical protein
MRSLGQGWTEQMRNLVWILMILTGIHVSPCSLETNDRFLLCHLPERHAMIFATSSLQCLAGPGLDSRSGDSLE